VTLVYGTRLIRLAQQPDVRAVRSAALNALEEAEKTERIAAIVERHSWL
jgi:hypothetical protein